MRCRWISWARECPGAGGGGNLGVCQAVAVDGRQVFKGGNLAEQGLELVLSSGQPGDKTGEHRQQQENRGRGYPEHLQRSEDDRAQNDQRAGFEPEGRRCLAPVLARPCSRAVD